MEPKDKYSVEIENAIKDMQKHSLIGSARYHIDTIKERDARAVLSRFAQAVAVHVSYTHPPVDPDIFAKSQDEVDPNATVQVGESKVDSVPALNAAPLPSDEQPGAFTEEGNSQVGADKVLG